jgi:hypothetical protein
MLTGAETEAVLPPAVALAPEFAAVGDGCKVPVDPEAVLLP